MIPENLKEIALKIEEAKKVRENNQEAILAYCKDKSFDLEERFSYWQKYCNKNEKYWVMHKDDAKSNLLGFLIERANENCDRGNIIDYNFILSQIDDFDEEVYEKLPNFKRELLIDSILQGKPLNFNEDSDDWDTIIDKTIYIVMETLIQENFGSYIFDW
jgi:hypothetical protein